jgi:hypothetical protein
MLWFTKYCSILQLVLASVADGTPHNEGLGLPSLMSSGTAARKNDPMQSCLRNALKKN